MLNSRRFRATALAILLSSAAVLAQAVDLTGAGASFPAPVYAKWAGAYQKATGNKVNYQSIGSGGGIKQINARTIDFGATDMPLKAEVLKKDGLVQFPTVIGGVVPVINVSGVQAGQLQLTGGVLANIYAGTITKWNDKAIAELNPRVVLPNIDIAVVRRADGSGTTFIFTNYLSKISPEWKSKIGEGTVVQWPTGMGGKGNEGVAAFVQRIPNSIGYVEYAYAKQNKLTWVRLQNASGAFVAPDEETFKAAAASADWNKSAFGEILTNQPGKNAWPITGATFILMHKIQGKPEQAAEVLKFFDWSYKHGSALAAELDYVPLPENLVKSIAVSWRNIQDASGKAVAK